MTDSMRTPSGAPSQKAREQHGDSQEKYPIFDHKSAHSALVLRGHSPDPAKVIARVRAWANANNDKAILAECDAATEKDGNSGKRASDMLVETRAANIENVDFGQRIVTVVAVPYEEPTEIVYRQEVWREIFSRTAFAGIETRQSRIPANREHNPDHLIGKVIETYPTRDEGLVVDIKVSRTPRGDETLALADDQVVSASAGFAVKDPYQDQILDRHTHTRRINRAFLDHVALVQSPAYAGARVLATRNLEDTEAALPPLIHRPGVEEWLSDPIVQWANSRNR